MTTWSGFRRLLVRLGLVALGGAVLLAFPAPVFSSSLTRGGITLHATEPLPPNAVAIMDEALARLRQSPLYDPALSVNVFVCRNDWRWLLYSGGNGRSAAVARAPFVHDVIVRGADLTHNRYQQAGGQLAPTERPLSYLLAHEVTHELVAHALTLRELERMPAWLNEGYADLRCASGQLRSSRRPANPFRSIRAHPEPGTVPAVHAARRCRSPAHPARHRSAARTA